MAGVGILFEAVEQFFGELPSVAQTEVEALAGHGMQRLRGVADPDLARLHELPANAQGERVGGARSGLHEIEPGAELRAQRREELVVVEREKAFLRYRANTSALEQLLGFFYSECCTRNRAVEPRRIAASSVAISALGSSPSRRA